MDPLAQAKQKMANGQPLTREEVGLIANAGVTSSEINAVKNPPPAAKPSVTQTGGYILGPSAKPKPFQPPKGNVIPTPQNPENVALAQNISKTMGDDVETYEQWIARTGKPMSPGSAKEYNAMLKSLVPQGAPAPVAPPVAIAPTPIQTVASAAPVATPKAPAVETKPVTAKTPLKDTSSINDIRDSVGAMDQFLKSNPDGLTLANILDAVGVGLSARGGVQRETQLSKRKQAEMQYAQQLGQAQALKAMDLDNQSKLLQIQLNNATAQNNQEAALQIKNKLQEIEAQKKANIEQAKAVSGVSGLTGAGGVGGLVNKYSGVSQ